MKRFYQIAAIIAACSLCVGFVVGLAGLCIGGTVDAAEKLVDGRGIHFNFPFFWFGDDDEDDFEYSWDVTEDTVDEVTISEKWEKDDGIDDGIEEENENGYSITGNLEEYIEELDWNIGYGKLTVKEGDSFSIQGKNLYENGFYSYVEDGVWYIDCELENSGFDLDWNWKSGFKASYTEHAFLEITIPKGKVFENAILSLGVGEAKLSDMTFEEAEIDIGFGNATFTNFTILEEGDISVGTGELKLVEFVGNDISIDCGVGTIKGNHCTLNGESELDCGVGSIGLELSGRKEDYNYEVNCDMGSVKIGENSFVGMNDTDINNEAENWIEMDCGMGSISIEFEKE